MAKKQRPPAQKTTLHAFFHPSPDKHTRSSGGKRLAQAGEGSKEQPVELLSDDSDDNDTSGCSGSRPAQPASKRVKREQPRSPELVRSSSAAPVDRKGKGKMSPPPPCRSLGLPSKPVANPNSLAARLNAQSAAELLPVSGKKEEQRREEEAEYVPSSSAHLMEEGDCAARQGPAFIPTSIDLLDEDDLDGGIGGGIGTGPRVPLPRLPSCRVPSPDWPPDIDDVPFDPADVDGLMNDDEQGSQLDPGEESEGEELDEVDLGEMDGGDRMREGARRTGGLGDDGEGESEVGWLGQDAEEEKPEGRRLSTIRHSLPPSAPKPAPAANAFSLLMSAKKPSLWQAAEEDRSLKRGGKPIARGERRKAPFFKVMTGMPVAVDAFRYGKVPGVTAYLLSHAHSDHYTRLSKAWNAGPIYCSQTTANLITRVLGVERKWVVPLEYGKPTVLPDTGGVVCTMIEANHCPGSALFLFEGRRTVNAGDSPYPASGVGSPRVYRYLHCGDFRACPRIVLHPAVAKGPLDEVYLDTTYLNPQYCFPPQPVVIRSVSALVRSLVLGAAEEGEGKGKGKGLEGWVKRDESEQAGREREERLRLKGSRTLVAVGTYSIGKERIVKGIAQALGTKIYADARKRGLIADQVEDPDLHALMTSRTDESQVHMISLQDICPEGLANHLGKHKDKYDRIIGFRPTGWTFGGTPGTTQTPDLATLIERDRVATDAFDAKDIRPMRGSSERVMMLGVPYSEHSSFTELTCFCLSVPGEPRIIPTVNVGSAKSREKMDVWIKKWATEKRRRLAQGLRIIEYRSLDYW